MSPKGRNGEKNNPPAVEKITAREEMELHAVNFVAKFGTAASAQILGEVASGTFVPVDSPSPYEFSYAETTDAECVRIADGTGASAWVSADGMSAGFQTCGGHGFTCHEERGPRTDDDSYSSGFWRDCLDGQAALRVRNARLRALWRASKHGARDVPAEEYRKIFRETLSLACKGDALAAMCRECRRHARQAVAAMRDRCEYFGWEIAMSPAKHFGDLAQTWAGFAADDVQDLYGVNYDAAKRMAEEAYLDGVKDFVKEMEADSRKRAREDKEWRDEQRRTTPGTRAWRRAQKKAAGTAA